MGRDDEQLPDGVTLEASGETASYRHGPDALDRALLTLEVKRVAAPARVMTGARVAGLATLATSAGAGLAIWAVGTSATWAIAVPAALGALSMSLARAQAQRGPQRVEIGLRNIRVWRNASVRTSLRTVPRESVRAIAIASRVDGTLRAVDIDDPPLHTTLCIVVRHASGVPTPLVEDIASLDDASAIARALHAPLRNVVELDLPGGSGAVAHRRAIPPA